MNLREAVAALGGMVAVAATAAAAVTIWALIAAPTTVAAGLVGGTDAQPLHIVVRALYDTVIQFVRYL